MLSPQKVSGWKKVALIGALVVPLFLIGALGASNRNTGALVVASKNMEVKHKCACMLTCIDGRPLDAGSVATKKLAKTKVVDTITRAGIVKKLADNKDKISIDNLKDELEISVKRHDTKKVTIVAHDDCAGNPVSKEQQFKDLKKAKKTVDSWNLGVKVILLWVESPWKEAQMVK